MYYKIQPLFDPKIIGSSGEQVIIYKEQDYHLSASYSFVNISIGRKIEYDFRLPKLELSYHAKLTDRINYIRAGDSFLIFSNDVIDILKKLSLPNYNIYPIDIYKRGKLFKCNVLHFPSHLTNEFFDWKNGKFTHIINSTREIVNELQFNNYEEFLDYKKNISLKTNHKERITVAEKYYKLGEEYDLFAAITPIVGYYCSEKFKNIITEKGLTGFIFEEIKNPIL